MMKLFPLLLPALLVLGCHQTGKPGETGDSVDTSDSADSGDSGADSGDTSTTGGFCDVEALFNDACVMCHSASGRSGGLDLETDPYTAIVDVASAGYAGRTLVTPGNADTSFLYLKMTDAQTAAEGNVMPTTGQLPAADTELIRAWIAAGASSECSNPDTGVPTRHHPDGYADPTLHGMSAKYQEEACTSCHGADLAGGDVGVSCDSCHDAGWRTDCTWCHGGTDNNSGAPPVDMDNSTSSLSFPEHTSHVERTIHAEWDCIECHTTPDDVLSVGHLFVGDATPRMAELMFADGQSSRGTYAGAGSCANLYCHGTGQSGSTGSATSGQTETCHMCHGDSTNTRGMSGEHGEHIGEGVSCGECHSDDVSGNSTITNPDLHVDTHVNVHLPSGVTYSGGTCTGTCHGERHEGERW